MVMWFSLRVHASSTVINKCEIEQIIRNQKIRKQSLCFNLKNSFQRWKHQIIKYDYRRNDEISIIIEKNLVTYEYDSFARDYHVYLNIWNPLIGNILRFKREPKNEVNKHAVAIMWSNSFDEESVDGHILQNISKFPSISLMIPFTSIEVEVVSKSLGLRVAMDWKFPLNIFFTVKKKLSNDWLKIRNGKKRARM